MGASRLVFTVMIFSVLLNLSVGLMGQLLPGLYGSDSGNTGGLSFNEATKSGIETYYNETLTPSSQINGGNGFFSSILDAITAGYFTKLKDFINTYMFGIITILQDFFSSYMSVELSSFVFGSLKFILSLCYIFGFIWIFSGRNLTKESL